MENNNKINLLIDYIYGNLTQSEKDTFEEKMKQDPDLKKEVEELMTARKGLERIGEREVMDPYVFGSGFGTSLRNGRSGTVSSTALKYVVAVAASVVILFLAGYFTNASLRFNGNSVILSFGNSVNIEKPLSRSEIEEMIRSGISENNQSLAVRITDAESSFQQALDDHHRKESAELKKLFAAYTHAKNDELELALNRMQKSNSELVNDYLQQYSAQQQQYVRNVISDFSVFLQKQRTQDLEKIQSSLVTLKQSQDVQKMETSQILTSIISTMNTQNN